MLAAKDLEKASAASNLLTCVSYLEGIVKGFGGFLGDTSVVPRGKPEDPEKQASVENSSDSSQPKATHAQIPFAYPKQRLGMPNINSSGAAPQYDGTHFSHWKSTMESHLRSCSLSFGRSFKEGITLTMRMISPRPSTMIINSMQPLVTRFEVQFTASFMTKFAISPSPRNFGRGL